MIKQRVKKILVLAGWALSRSVPALALGTCLLLQPIAVLQAEAPECYSDQYVLRRSTAVAKRVKAIEALEEVSREPLALTAETNSAMLIEKSTRVAQRLRSGASTDEEGEIERFSRQHLCAKVKQKERRKRKKLIKSGASGFVRRNYCDCNGVLRMKGTTPNDPLYGLQWGFHQSSDIDINAPEAHDLWTGTSQTVIAVIDSGVDYNHEDLQGNMWVNQAEALGQPGVDDDGNGYIDDFHGINAINRSGNPMDDHGHGTHVAGTIGGQGNNATGVAGVMFDVSIMGVKFLNSSGNGSLFDSVAAIDYVTNMKVNHGVNVVLSNNSWGGGGGYYALRDSIARAGDEGILFVAAAGNSSQNIDSVPHYPASYSLDNIVSVAAVDQYGQLANFSCFGVNNVDVGAPGVQIASTYPAQRYYYMSGTSMAAPHVSGGLGLLASRAPDLGAAELKDILMQTVRPLSSLDGKVQTGGMMDVYAMLNEVRDFPQPPPEGSPPPISTPTSLAVISPAGALPFSETSPAFHWSEIGWDSFSLHVFDASDGRAVFVSTFGEWSTSTQPALNLDVSKNYQWFVRAYQTLEDGTRLVTQSDTGSFWYEAEAPPSEPNPEPEPGIFTLSGRVVGFYSGDLRPLPQALVELHVDGLEAQVRYAGADGEFRFPDIDGPVDFTLTVSAPGTSGSTITGTLTRDSQFTVVVAPVLAKITGILKDSTHRPLVNVDADAGPLGKVRTDSAGRFVFWAAWGEQYAITLSHPDLHFSRGAVRGTAYGAVERLIIGDLN